MIPYVDERSRSFGVEPICRTLEIASSSYYAARSRPPSARAIADEELKPKIAEIPIGRTSRFLSSGRPFAAGHRFDFGEPITCGTPPSNLTCAAFAVDPQFGKIETPNGSVMFLTLVGITAEELAQMKASTTAAVLDEIARSNPRLVSDPRR
jgi:hypothetical protein